MTAFVDATWNGAGPGAHIRPALASCTRFWLALCSTAFMQRGATRLWQTRWQIPRLYTTMPSATRNYAAAIDALNSLQSNSATIEAIRRSGKTVNELNEPEMTEYLQRIGHRRDELDRLNVIHITGTKGKGSTAAFCDALLQKVRPPGAGKIGLYTSPHMVAARERIRIDGVPISEADFAKFFWEVWDRLEQNPHRALETTPLRPVYFRFMTILAFHVFISLEVSATLLEVGIGGMYDSTNIVQHPVVTGVTALGLDHTAILGHTLEEVAWQKAGIFKPGIPALSVEQPENAQAVLQKYAKQVQASSFQVVPVNRDLLHVKLGLPGDHQYSNASLALELIRTFVLSDIGKHRFPGASEKLGCTGASVPDLARVALSSAFWPGRCQVVPAKEAFHATYYLDGAHTVESVRVCVQWFVRETAQNKQPKVLVFNCTNGRSAYFLLGSMLEELKKCQVDAQTFFRRVFFCTNNTYADGGSASDLMSRSVDPKDIENMSVQRELLSSWCQLQGLEQDGVLSAHNANVRVDVVPSIEHVMAAVRDYGACASNTIPDVFVAGSLHLVGGFMSHLQARHMLNERLQSTHVA